jgi:hypothetical protein
MVEVGRKVGDLLGQLGSASAEVLEKSLGSLSKTSLARLQNLKLAYGTAALEANKFGKVTADGRANIPPPGFNPHPTQAMKERAVFLGATYAQEPEIERARSTDPLPGLMNAKTKRRTELSMLVQQEASVRSRFEKIAGGQVVTNGRVDGTISMMTPQVAGVSGGMATSALTGGGGPAGGKPNVYAMLMAMDQAVLDEAQRMRPGASQFWELDVGVGSLSEEESQYQLGRDDEDEEGESSSALMAKRAMDAGLGVKDLLQPKDQGGESVDTGTLRLKRLNDKREQMYDLYNKMNDKYNQSAKAAIDNMRA